MKAYKGFNKDMTCRGFRYEEGGTYELPEGETAKLCKSGFHACKAPIDCLCYYAPADAVYHEVELDGVTDETSAEDSKRVGSKIKIGARLDVARLCSLQFEYVREHCTNENNAEPGKPATAGDYGAVTAGYKGAATAGYKGAATAGSYGAATAGDSGAATAGDYGAATAGYKGAATAGYKGAATAGSYGAVTAGDSGAATAGDYGAATAGYKGAAAAGYKGAATAGDSGAATAGDYGAATSRGASAVGKNGIASARGNGVKVRGGMGAVLVIMIENDVNYEIKEWKTGIVDGETLKADTWYTLENGEWKEVPDDGDATGD